MIFSVWKPLRGPLNDWPLGIWDAHSVNWRNDIMAGDVVYENFATENLQIMYNPDHKWYYLPDQTTSEALIFKSADSEHAWAPGDCPPPFLSLNDRQLMCDMLTPIACPHAGFYNPKVSPDELPRESIDCRAFVFFADLPEYPPVVEDIFQWHL